MKILILGQPKSGTTALFYWIKHSLPTDTVCLFEPIAFSPPKSLSAGATILAKALLSPHLDLESFSTFDKKIFIVRDPRDTLISQLLYAVRHTSIPADAQKSAALLDLLRRKEQEPSTVSIVKITEFMEQLGAEPPILQRWSLYHQMSTKFTSEHQDYFVFRYEDLIDDQVGQLADYLGFELLGRPTVGRRHRRVARTKNYGDWRNWFEPEDVAFFRPLMTEYMKQYGYPNDWDLGERQPIPPEHGSEYVKRLIRERRLKDGGLCIFGPLVRWYRSWRGKSN